MKFIKIGNLQSIRKKEVDNMSNMLIDDLGMSVVLGIRLVYHKSSK